MKVEIRKGREIFSGTLTGYHFRYGILFVKLVGKKEPIILNDSKKILAVRLSRANMQNRKFIVLESESFEFGNSINDINQAIANKEGTLL